MVDLARWPLVMAQPPSAKPLSDEGSLDDFFRDLDLVLSKRRPFVVLFDARRARNSSNERKRLIAWANLHDRSISKYMVALAVLVESEIERAYVTAAFWNLKRSYHARIFQNASEAEHWLLAEFARGEGVN